MSNNNEQRIERAYRLAFPSLQPPWKPAPTPELAWADATSILHLDQPATSHGGCLSHAILALALLDEGGGTLGRWYADDTLTGWQFYLGDSASENGRSAYRTFSMGRAYWGGVTLAPGAYLDGTASELLLLMAAADELARRGVQP